MSAPRGNRCYVLTPPGVGAIGLIRLAGPRADEIINHLFRSVSGKTLSANNDRRLRYGRFLDGAELVDDVIVVRADIGTEPGIEIAAHGGVRVLERILQTLDRHGAPLADAMCPGGSIWAADSLIKAEVVDALARAKTERAVRFLCHQRGHLGITLSQLASQCRSSPAAARDALESMVAGFEMAQRVLDGATVVLLGPPNSGKSTLFNQLVGRSSVIVSPQAGTTRDWVAESIEMAGAPVTLVDTAGQSGTPDLVEGQAMEAGRGIGKTADLCLLVFDGSKPVPPATQSLRDVTASARRRLVVANKLDLGRAWDESVALGEHGLPAEGLIRVSATEGTGLEQLAERIASLAGFGPWSDPEPGLFTERQVRVATEALMQLPRHRAAAASIIEERLIGMRPVTVD